VERPERVKIGPYIYDIKYDKELVDKHLLETKEEVYGYCDYDKLEIVLNPELSEQLIQEVLLHEILHGVNAIATRIGADDEEKYVTIGSPILLQALRENGEVLLYLITDVS
jgi:hypothetical protein